MPSHFSHTLNQGASGHTYTFTRRPDGLTDIDLVVVRDGKIETRPVRIGLVSDGSIEIREGLKEGEVVVANAGGSLHDGDQVKTVFADQPDK